MLGNIDYIIHIVSKRHPELPKDFIEEAYYEYFRDFRKALVYSDKANIRLSGLGLFYTKNNKIRSYIRYILPKLRWVKKELLKTDNSEERVTNLLTMREDYRKKLRSSWSQLEEIRKKIIHKNNRRIAWKKYYEQFN